MGKTILLFLLLLLASHQVIQAQSDYNWEPIGLTVSGDNIQQGIQAFYRIAEYNEEKFIVIKFINYNNNDVTLEWQDGVFTHDLEWVNNSNDDSFSSISIQAKEKVSGDCSNLDDMLVIRISDFVTDFSAFNKYRTLSLVVR